MGAVSEYRTTYARSASQAVDQLTEQAEYDHGHDPYSGTIATCSHGFTMGKIDQKAFTKAAINRWINKWIDDCPKRDIMVHGYTHVRRPQTRCRGWYIVGRSGRLH